MAVDERSRHQLFRRLEEILGEEHATVLMEHLPPVGWADVATKRDLDQLKAQLKAELRADFRVELNAALQAQTRAVVQWLISATFAIAALAFAAVRLV